MTFPLRGYITIRAPAQELRAIFNAMEIALKGRRGILRREVARRSIGRPGHLPPGSRSLLWAYFVPHNNWKLALAHVYLGRGGQLLSEPDPKSLWIEELHQRV